MEQGPKDSIQVNHCGTFLLLLTLAIIRPEGFFPGIGLPVGPLCLLAALVILPWKIHSTLGLPEFWRRHRLPIQLIVSYQLLCTISLLYNMDRYADLTEFFRWGVVFIAGQMLLPLCVFIFLLPENTRGLTRSELVIIPALTGLLVTLIPASVLIQVYYPDTATLTIQYFVGGDNTEIRSPRRGILATSTDLGAISALLSWAALALAWQNARDTPKIAAVLALFAMLSAITGILSMSRNFILFMTIATVTLLIAKLWMSNKNKMLLVPGLLSLAGLFYASAYIFPEGMLLKLGAVIPYFEKVQTGTEISLIDLLPHVSVASLGPRAPLWESTIKLIASHPFIGISNGGFRLAETCACLTDFPRANTHNILLQSAIDAGVLGVAVISLLLSYLIKQSAHNEWSLALILGTIATLMVDNFTDHSYAWIVVASYVGVLLAQPRQLK